MLNQSEVDMIVEIERSGRWTQFVDTGWPELSSRRVEDLRSAARDIAPHFPPQEFFSQVDLLPVDEGETIRALRNLRENGYHVFEKLVSTEVIAGIRQELSTKCYFDKSNSRVFTGISALTSAHGGATKWITDMQDVVECRNVLALSTQKSILDVIRGYLGVEPILMQANCWWSTPARRVHNNPDASAQLFHQDNEFLSFVKVFIYLNDVSMENGPHRLIAGSHLDYRELFPDRSDASDRVSEEQIAASVSSDRVSAILGKAGTVIAVDTTCLHAGSIVQKGFRALLQFEYASSPYYSTIQPFMLTARARSEELPGIPEHARLLRNFRNDDYSVWITNRRGRSSFARVKSAIWPYLRFGYRVLRRRTTL